PLKKDKKKTKLGLSELEELGEEDGFLAQSEARPRSQTYPVSPTLMNFNFLKKLKKPPAEEPPPVEREEGRITFQVKAKISDKPLTIVKRKLRITSEAIEELDFDTEVGNITSNY